MFSLAIRASKTFSLLFILISSTSFGFSQGRSTALLETRENNLFPGRFAKSEPVDAPEPAAILTYVGRMTIDSQEVMAIDVRPSVEPDPNHMSERYFVGRVWIDPVSFQVVRVKGTVEPQGKQRFPLFETWRQPLNGAPAFPVRTEADAVLHFLGRDVHYRIKVRYYDYKVFGSKLTIKDIDQPVSDETESSPNGNNILSPTSNDILKREPPAMKPARPSAMSG